MQAQYSTGLSSSNRSVLALVRSSGCFFGSTSLACFGVENSELEAQKQLVRCQEEAFSQCQWGSRKVEFESSHPLQVDPRLCANKGFPLIASMSLSK
jgi:hypothetical protein